MKKINYYILAAVILLIALIALKPSDESIKAHFKDDAKRIVERDFILSNKKDGLNIPAGAEISGANKLSNDVWEKCIHINDLFLFKTVELRFITDEGKENHIAVLNTFF